MGGYDIAVCRRARVGVLDDGEVSIDPPLDYVRVRGVDLRAVAQRSAIAREQDPHRDVLVDIDVMIDVSAAEARARLAVGDRSPARDTLVYIGTPTGLAGLITDLHTLGICDGAILRPLSRGVAELIRDRVIGDLATMAPDHRQSDDTSSA